MNFRCSMGWCCSLVGAVKKIALRLIEPYSQDKFKAPHKNSEKGGQLDVSEDKRSLLPSLTIEVFFLGTHIIKGENVFTLARSN